MSENVGASTCRNPKVLHGLYGDNFTYSCISLDMKRKKMGLYFKAKLIKSLLNAENPLIINKQLKLFSEISLFQCK
jgi:hypothetical protein